MGRRQAQFLAALTGGADGMAALATVLAEKRARAVRRAVPDLAVTPAFRERFVPWASTHPLRADGGPGDDAAAFLRTVPPADRSPELCLGVEAARHRPRAAVHAWRSRRGTVLAARLGRRRWLLARR